jgi:hypothetical protein
MHRPVQLKMEQAKCTPHPNFSSDRYLASTTLAGGSRHHQVGNTAILNLQVIEPIAPLMCRLSAPSELRGAIQASKDYFYFIALAMIWTWNLLLERWTIHVIFQQNSGTMDIKGDISLDHMYYWWKGGKFEREQWLGDRPRVIASGFFSRSRLQGIYH